MITFFENIQRRAESKNKKMFTCQHCDEKQATKKCGSCFHASYCSKECQQNAWHYHKRACFKLPEALYRNQENTMLHKAIEFNLFQEYQAIKNMPKNTEFNKARQCLYDGVIRMILIDPIDGDMPEDNLELLKEFELAQNQIKLAGHMFNALNEMHDSFTFLFIPDELHRDIDFLWDGIGSWKC